MKKINKILKKQIELIKLEKRVINNIERISSDLVKELKIKLKKMKIKADVFIGGSLAKDTIIKTDDNKYDVDIFVRFDYKYPEEKIPVFIGKMLGKNAKKVHGSRDYFQFTVNNMIIEVIPVIKIKKPDEARNVTDLSYFHVNYVLKKIKKSKKLADEIRLAKAFCHAQNCYGAESYIKGFSGYALELLIIHYKSFLNFIKQAANADISKNKKLIIDDSKFYKKKNILIELNEAKIQSPVIIIDPTFKERNALSGLSYETFLRFKKTCNEFLKNPSQDFFKKKNVYEEMINEFPDLSIVSVKTNKQAGDIAGTKSKKFFNLFVSEIKKEFNAIKAEFDYNEEKNTAYYYLALEKKPDEVVKGPPIISVINLNSFKKVHPDAFIENQVAYAHVSHKLSFWDFFRIFLEKNKKIIRDMSVTDVRLAR